MHDVKIVTLCILFGMRMTEALTHLHHDVANTRDRDLLSDASGALEDRLEVLARDVLQGDEEGAVRFAEIEDLGDIRVVELAGDLGLIDEHLDEGLVLGDVGQDFLDRQETLEPLDPKGFRLEDLSHTPDIDPF